MIGATTENPSFEVIPALLSRCRVFILHELTSTDMKEIISRSGYSIPDDAMNWIIALASGDARQALGVLSHTKELYDDITVENLQNTIQSKHLRYDKKGEEHHNTISAFIKKACVHLKQMQRSTILRA